MSRAFFTRTLLAAGTAAAVTAGVFVAPHAVAQETPTNAAAPVQDAPQEGLLKAGDVKSGTVSWPIKKSYLDYIQGRIGGGKITVSDGARAKTNGNAVTGFDFPVDPKASKLDKDGNGTIALLGSLAFLGHKGLGQGGTWGLDLSYSNFKIKIEEGTKASIIADYKVKGGVNNQNVQDRSETNQVLATFDLGRKLDAGAGTSDNFSGLIPTLQKGGAQSLLSYPEGRELKDGRINLSLNFAEDGDKPVEPETAEEKAYDYSGGIGINRDTFIGFGVVLALLAILGAVGAWFAGLIPGVPAPR